MRVVRLIPVSYLKSPTFRYWTTNVLNHLNSLPGTDMHVVFDDYQYVSESPFKNEDISEWEKIVSELDQELPDAKEWSSFLSNGENKYHLANLLVNLILESDITEKTIFVKKGSQCYYKLVAFLFRNYRCMLCMHAVYTKDKNVSLQMMLMCLFFSCL